MEMSFKMVKRKYCLDCKIELISSRYNKRVKRCSSCANKTRKKYKWSEKAKQKIMGEANNNYKNGISSQRKKALNLSGQRCICGSNLNLCVHHIDQNRNNNELINLLVVCKKCHCKIHFPDGKFGKNKVSAQRIASGQQ